MPKSNPAAVLFLLWALLPLACRNNSNSSSQQESNVAKIDTTLVAIPDPQDLLEILGGSWQNEKDSTDQMSITDSLLTHIRHGQVLEKNIIEIDATCTAGSCATGDQPEDGWCFVEKTPAGDQCMMVLKCNKKTLQIRPLGAPKTELVFRKL